MGAVHTGAGSRLSQFRGRQCKSKAWTMHASSSLLLLGALACLFMSALACEPDQSQTGCKIFGTSCYCGYGCKSEYVYRTRQSCTNALIKRSSNICDLMPCIRGACTQTAQEPGFACKCEGTGYYGQRCEKACPAFPIRGYIFPHECIVI